MTEQTPETEPIQDKCVEENTGKRESTHTFRDERGKFTSAPPVDLSTDLLQKQVEKIDQEKTHLSHQLEEARKHNMALEVSEAQKQATATAVANADRDMLAAVQRATAEKVEAMSQLESIRKSSTETVEEYKRRTTELEDKVKQSESGLAELMEKIEAITKERDSLREENVNHRKRIRSELEAHMPDILEYIRKINGGTEGCAMEQRVMESIARGDRTDEVQFMVSASAKSQESERDAKRMRDSYEDLKKQKDVMSTELDERRAAAPSMQTASSRFEPVPTPVSISSSTAPSARIEIPGGVSMPACMSQELWGNLMKTPMSSGSM